MEQLSAQGDYRTSHYTPTQHTTAHLQELEGEEWQRAMRTDATSHKDGTLFPFNKDGCSTLECLMNCTTQLTLASNAKIKPRDNIQLGSLVAHQLGVPTT